MVRTPLSMQSQTTVKKVDFNSNGGLATGLCRGMSKEQVVEKARSMVAYARSFGCNDVEFSPEDAGRVFLCIVKFEAKKMRREVAAMEKEMDEVKPSLTLCGIARRRKRKKGTKQGKVGSAEA
ncbi:hypothetical protein L1987_80729 [Smallanthus sonchifolius]|uniref:Uncharacterized protein n=1 Tax=Smallanthus sonchifolius TaxID=185202 RepID=A0ACB8YQ13_9ASTR|nr:hypothetical protein L1987_80729 [Smallanthus sonchifolius]